MRKLKVCLIYNGAPHYREGIFRLIEEEFDCYWYFGSGYGNIKQLPLSMFKNAKTLKRKRVYGPIYYHKGEVKLLLSKEFDVFFNLGEITNLSTWIGTILHNIFNRKRKVYWWTHGWLRKRGRLTQPLARFFNSLPHGTFVYGDKARNLMISAGMNGDKLFVIHNSLNYEQQIRLRGNITDVYRKHFGNSNPVLLFIGRLTRSKKLDMLLDAVNLLYKQAVNVNCVIIGDGSERCSLQEYVRNLGIEKYIWFYGACYDEKEKSELIASADICVSPGNIGLTAIDSMMYGTPCISMDNFSRQGPEHEAIIKDRTGDFFHENDGNDLAEKIRRWLQMDVDRESIRRYCYEEVDTKWTPLFQIDVIRKHLNP